MMSATVRLMSLSKAREGPAGWFDAGIVDCRGQIAAYKIPRYIRFTDEFPLTVTGKIQKFRMREVSVAELGLEQAGEVRTA